MKDKPKLEEFYDTSDPRGCSTSEYNMYQTALRNWERETEGNLENKTRQVLKSKINESLSRSELSKKDLIHIIEFIREKNLSK